jgi:hypothetical protein
MKIFLLDVWHDLRAKRLWPVAVVLLAGIVAVPFVLAKKAEEPTAAAPAPTAEAEAPKADGPAELAHVKLEELGQGTGSSLSSFRDPSNPFAPPRRVLEKISDEAEGEDAGGDASSGSGADVTVKGGSLGGGAGAGDVPADTGSGGSGGGSTGGGDSGDDAGSDTGDTGDTGETPAPPVDGGEKTTTVNYTYVADVTFRANNRRYKIEALEKLDILPDRANPLLIFLGVTQDAGNAVFLVDSTLAAAGEGTCKPSNSECAFLYLGPGSEHEFTNDKGDSYTLRVDEIRRVKLDDGKKRAHASKKDKTFAGASLRQPSARRAPAGRRRFSVPLLADLVSVSSTESINSNSDSDRR